MCLSIIFVLIDVKIEVFVVDVIILILNGFKLFVVILFVFFYLNVFENKIVFYERECVENYV